MAPEALRVPGGLSCVNQILRSQCPKTMLFLSSVPWNSLLREISSSMKGGVLLVPMVSEAVFFYCPVVKYSIWLLLCLFCWYFLRLSLYVVETGFKILVWPRI